jgi:hypothetical protein
MDKVWFNFLNEGAQFSRGAGNGQRAEPLPDKRTQPDGTGRSAAGACILFFDGAKGHGRKLLPFEWEIHSTGKGGRKVDFVTAFCEMAHPVLGNGGAAIGYKK